MNNWEFYNILESHYDEMIDFESSLKKKIEYLHSFIEPEFRMGLDLGCGTGADSIALSKLGLNVRALDHSVKMIQKAKSNAKNHGAEIKFSEIELTEIILNDGYYDFIVSLGNTLANLSGKYLKILFGKLEKGLSICGRIVIQIINYARFPNSGEYVLNRLENNDISIVRRYMFHDKGVEFIIDINDKKNDQKNNLVTKIFPHSLEFLIELANHNNLNYEIFGNLKKESYLKDQSENIVMVLSK
ncbi:MAG: methyltransferase domain-containing protein [Melioribacteraceae bacterium]|nr:methyltransferase domain-containing protein [Melioribacteraceae bacterium]